MKGRHPVGLSGVGVRSLAEQLYHRFGIAVLSRIGDG